MPFVTGQLARWSTRYREAVLDVLFPPACLACSTQVEQGTGDSYCDDCIAQFAEFEPPFCSGCGASVPHELPEGKTCGHCNSKRRRFDRAVTLGPYEHLLREQLLKAKKPQGELIALALANRWMSVRGGQVRSLEIDVVCAVPMHWRRRIWRLTNSPATMAGAMARQLGVPVATGLLRRTRHTLPQFQLSNTDRQSNVRSAFRVAPGYRLQSAHVLLVDDILTTGATVHESARSLLAAGAKRVTVAAIARSYSDR